jgi:hypothetical protein
MRMQPTSTYDARRWFRADVMFAVLSLGLLSYSLLAWRQLFGLGPVWRPLQLISLNTCLVLQSLASFARRRSQQLFWVLLATSLACLAVSIVAR